MPVYSLFVGLNVLKWICLCPITQYIEYRKNNCSTLPVEKMLLSGVLVKKKISFSYMLYWISLYYNVWRDSPCNSLESRFSNTFCFYSPAGESNITTSLHGRVVQVIRADLRCDSELAWWGNTWVHVGNRDLQWTLWVWHAAGSC